MRRFEFMLIAVLIFGGMAWCFRLWRSAETREAAIAIEGTTTRPSSSVDSVDNGVAVEIPVGITRVDFAKTLRLHGVVVDERGAAVGGAMIVASTKVAGGTHSRARDAASNIVDPRSESVVFETDETGAFSGEPIAIEHASQFDLKITAAGLMTDYRTLAGDAEMPLRIVMRDERRPTVEIGFTSDSMLPHPARLRVSVAGPGAFERNYGFPVKEFAPVVVEGKARIEGVEGEVVDILVCADGYVRGLAVGIRVGGSTPRNPARCSVRLGAGGRLFGEVSFEGEGPEPKRLTVAAWPADKGDSNPNFAPRIRDAFAERGAGRTSHGLLKDSRTQFVDVVPEIGTARFLIGGLQPGPYFCAVVGDDCMPRSKVLQTVVVDEGQSSGPVALTVSRGFEVTAKATFRDRRMPGAAELRGPRGPRASSKFGKNDDRGVFFTLIPPGPYVLLPCFGLTGAIGPEYADLGMSVESFFQALWECGGVPQQVFVGEGSLQFTIALDPNVARFTAWLKADGESELRENARLAAGGKSPPFASFKESIPEARVASALLNLHWWAVAHPESCAATTEGFRRGAIALDIEAMLLGMAREG